MNIANTEIGLNPNNSVIKRLWCLNNFVLTRKNTYEKVQVGKDQEKAQSGKDSHSKNQGGKKPNQQPGTYTMKTFRKPNEQLFSQ